MSLEFLGKSDKIESFQELDFSIGLAVKQGARMVGIDLKDGSIVRLRFDYWDGKSSSIPVELKS